MCDFNPTWPPAPAPYSGNFTQYLLSVLAWAVLAFASAIFDLVGGLAVGLSCLVYAALSAPVYFLFAIFASAPASFVQFGPWAPIVATLVFSAVILILIALFMVLYREVPENIAATTAQIEGKSPPSTEPTSEVGEIGSEL